jgi:uncharacterized protein YidB (DUF937 family)
MGILDSILEGIGGQGQAQGQGQGQGPGLGGAGTAALIQLALQLLAGGAARGGGTGGAIGGGMGGGMGAGLDGLIRQFDQAGLGREMNSWIGTGQNLPVSPDQLAQVFGRGSLEQMAQTSGLGVDQVSNGLSDLLPQLIDRVTPDGRVPAQGIDGALADLSRMLPR